jgi:glycosyltransferase involved in cell wall biosynthesis
MNRNFERQYLERWMGTYVPEDRRVEIDAVAFARHAHPVMYLNSLKSALTVDARFILLRPTMWGSRLKAAHPISRRACQLSLEAAGYEIITTEYGMLSQVHSLPIDWLNAVFSRIPIIRQLCHYELWLMRLKLPAQREKANPSVSIIMPCRNEEGTIEEAVRRMPALGLRTEIICIEGHSRDNTLRELQRVRDIVSHVDVKVIVQTGKGKKNAVVEGCTYASGDILIVFDSDITVAPEDMRTFYEALVTGHGDLINGSRLLFTLEKDAMRWPNFIFNHIFSWVISYSGILGQTISDTLCGTKVCWRRDYERSRIEHAWLWNLDPFGDFSWLFGISMLGGKIKDLPVRYYARTYGSPLQGSFRYGIELGRVLWNIGLVRIVRCHRTPDFKKTVQQFKIK